jgi:hypothetical protein
LNSTALKEVKNEYKNEGGGIYSRQKKKKDGSFAFFHHHLIMHCIFFSRHCILNSNTDPDIRITTKVCLLNFSYQSDYSLDQNIDMKLKVDL